VSIRDAIARHVQELVTELDASGFRCLLRLRRRGDSNSTCSPSMRPRVKLVATVEAARHSTGWSSTVGSRGSWRRVSAIRKPVRLNTARPTMSPDRY
jgi:hypothetical protein